eukprot:3496696-Rhodomonas_salina.2
MTRGADLESGEWVCACDSTHSNPSSKPRVHLLHKCGLPRAFDFTLSGQVHSSTLHAAWN